MHYYASIFSHSFKGFGIFERIIYFWAGLLCGQCKPAQECTTCTNKPTLEKAILIRYLRYSHKSGTIVFSIANAMIQKYFHIACTSFTEFGIPQHVIYSWATSSRINNMHEYTNLGKSSASDGKFCPYDGAWYNKYSGITYVIISQKFSEWVDFLPDHGNIWQTTYEISG